MLRTTTAFLVGAATATALVATDTTRYESLAPEPRETAERLAACPVSLVDAIEAAQAKLEGHASSAELVFGRDGPRITVDVYGEQASARVTIDGKTGKVLEEEPLRRLPGALVEGDPVVSESGLMYYDLVEGDGDEVPSSVAMVRFHIDGYLSDGTLFDSTVQNGQPRLLPLDRTVRGFQEGVASMRVGGKRKLVIPYPLAFGEHGKPPIVPHRAVIIYDVELLGVVP